MTRNALSGYQRFKFLFSLPGTLEKSIQKEEFDQAINDYSRAKALFEQPETDKPVCEIQICLKLFNLVVLFLSKTLTLTFYI